MVVILFGRLRPEVTVTWTSVECRAFTNLWQKNCQHFTARTVALSRSECDLLVISLSRSIFPFIIIIKSYASQNYVTKTCVWRGWSVLISTFKRQLLSHNTAQYTYSHMYTCCFLHYFTKFSSFIITITQTVTVPYTVLPSFLRYNKWIG
jgi:hypothetical protein